MRNYLGVVIGVAALCVMSWAQSTTPASAPAQTPAPAQSPAPAPDQTPQAQTANIPAPTVNQAVIARPYPRLELFLGGSYAEAGLFNAGHWAGLPGWDASLGVNATHWLGIIVEGGQYFGTSKIPQATPAPFPTCGGNPSFCPSGPYFNVDTREYNFLFGAQFARRKYERWTPFGELLYGHQGARGVASAQGETFTEVGSGRALVAGGGLDHKISERFAVRFKADYFQTGTAFPLLGKQKQDNFRFSVGLVIRSVHKKKRKLEDETQVEP